MHGRLEQALEIHVALRSKRINDELMRSNARAVTSRVCFFSSTNHVGWQWKARNLQPSTAAGPQFGGLLCPHALKSGSTLVGALKLKVRWPTRSNTLTMLANASWLSPASDTLLLPIYAAAGSCLLLLSGFLWTSNAVVKLRASYLKYSVETEASGTHDRQPHFGASILDHAEKHGGGAIFVFKLARLIGCLLLVALACAAVLLNDEDDNSLFVLAKAGLSFAASITSQQYLEPSSLYSKTIRSGLFVQLAMVFVYLYTAVLATASLSARVSVSKTAARHLNAVLATALLVYLLRDVVPLATYKLSPSDAWEGRLLWTKIVVLCITGGVIPLAMPRQHIPLDPKHPMPVANAEQTASILSLAFYFFLDPIIKLASRVSHLPYEDLPPLCDYDASEVLRKHAFPSLDAFESGKRRHLGIGLLSLFQWDFILMAFLLGTAALSKLVSPLSINRILDYLENPNNDDRVMKPWFWVFTLFLGPLTYSVFWQRYLFLGNHVLAKSTSIVTQLIFDHALRIRIKADTGSNKTGANLMGRINTLVTVDLRNINEARNFLFLFVLIPFEVIGSIVFLYQVLGWSAFVGLTVMVATFPLAGYTAKISANFQEKTLEKTDARVQSITEILGVLRMVKMFGWEKQMQDKIEEKRSEELVRLWWQKVLFTTISIVNTFVPVAIMLATYDLSASKVFSSMAVFEMLLGQIGFAIFCIRFTTRGKVSLDRVDEFLSQTELLDSFAKEAVVEAMDEPPSDLIGLQDAHFTWSRDAPSEADGTATPSRRFVLKVPGKLVFKRGAINLVVGPTGSGKTSLLMALLGEMHATRAGPTSWYHLPREGGVAFAAQESWVLNDTIKNNILFHAPYDAQRYQQVLYQCGLEPDLRLFEAGDETEVGENGQTLSGGQRARVTFARAIYSFSEIVLLDDVLAALDVHTARWVVDKCLRGPLIAGRTVIMVTHNIALTKDLALFVVSVGLDGHARGEASISAALAHDKVLAEEASKDEEIVERFDEKVDESDPAVPEPTKGDGKLIIAEEIELGSVSRGAMMMFFDAHSTRPYLFFGSLLFLIVLTRALGRAETWILGYWADQYGRGVAVPATKYISIYGAVVFSSHLIQSIAYMWFAVGAFVASKVIHTRLLNSVFSTTFRWLDSTPASRIIARFTADTSSIDDDISENFWELIWSTVDLLTRLVAIVIFTPVFFGPGVLVGFLGAWCGRVFMAAQMGVKREMSNARAPLLAHIGATMSGLASVRAYGAQDTFIKISMVQIDRLTRIQRTFSNLNRWVAARIDFLNLALAVSLAYHLLRTQTQSASNIGFTLTTAMGFSGEALLWVQFFNNFEVNSNSLERIKQFIEIEQEPAPTKNGVPPAYWPASGNLSVRGLSARYSANGSDVLRGLSFDIRSGERIGVVGRTGAGKSSLTLSLLRCIFTKGEVYYDGIETSSLNLDALRSNITIIPQAPELFAGSLRANIDILGQFDDDALNDALRSAGLAALQEEMEEGSAKLTLDTECAAGGDNLSLGQRQIVALARAIVRGSKLLILDEATSAIDYKTDNAIQTSLRTELPKDTTIITIAHRLQTVMDADKIMVLDAGNLVEFDTPKKLLEKVDGQLRALVEGSENKEELYAMAGFV
uniref:P-loop containing nucleoside triphosphate hydrolase protein n=1 Tax=Mycena chlorophos TaxID=658473 RepID=A0ABQ0L0P9_MYCCL|nr:predicted protein [Mycena chlorophos]